MFSLDSISVECILKVIFRIRKVKFDPFHPHPCELMLRSLELVNIVFPNSQLVKSVHLRRKYGYLWVISHRPDSWTGVWFSDSIFTCRTGNAYLGYTIRGPQELGMSTSKNRWIFSPILAMLFQTTGSLHEWITMNVTWMHTTCEHDIHYSRVHGEYTKWPILMVRSLELVIIVFPSSRLMKSVHLDLHTGTFPYTRVVNWGMNFWFYLHQ